MRYGKTTKSVHLRNAPRPNAPILDSLEPGYPLRIISYSLADKWLHVLVPPKGARDEMQKGWVIAEAVAIELEKPLFDKVDWAIASGLLLIAGLVVAAWVYLVN